jgi:chromosome segregation ATPase
MCASKTGSLAGLMLAVALAIAPAQAAEKKADPNKEQIRRLQAAQRKLEQEKVVLAQEKDAVAAELGEAKKKVEGEARRAASLRKDLDAQKAERDAVAGKLADTETELRKVLEQQRATEAERKRLDALAAQQKQSIAQCEEHNAKLHGQGVALLEKYQSKSCFDTALQNEPFTGLKRVEIENFVEDHREKLDEHKLDRQARR